MSKFSDQERTIAAAINAANEVLREAGINETQVVELVVANCNELKDLGAENASKSVWSCPCWDCVSNDGPRCICMGPACVTP
jgi:hypothetical protein